jgi:hypothetical protein
VRFDELPHPDGIVVNADTAEDVFPKLTDAQSERFFALLASLGAPLSLAALSFYRFTRRGEMENRRRKPRLRTEQFHAELLQAIAVARPNLWFEATARRDGIAELEDLLALAPNSVRDVYRSEDGADSDELADLIRGETRYIRNWAHPRQLLQLLKELFVPLDAQYKAATGLELTSIVTLIELVAKSLDDRFEHFVQWHNALRLTDPDAWPDVAREYWPHHKYTLLVASANAGRQDFDLVLHSPLPEVFVWSLNDLGNLLRLDDTSLILPIADIWSSRPGDIPESDIRHLLLDNPVWSRPFVRLTDGRFFLPFPGLLFSFGLQLLEEACKLHMPTYRRYIDKRWRSRFLEAKLGQLLKEAFPGLQVSSNNEYPGGQNDVLVRVGDFMLVLEAKSGCVSQSARRGGTAAIRHALEDIVIDGSEQAYRVIEFLQNAQRSGDKALLSDGRIIDVEGVVQYIPCVIHLEPVGRIGADTKRIARVLGDASNRVPAMAIALADFETILAVLESPEERLHYLYRRRQLELHRTYLADEMDLLLTYFDNQLNFDERFAHGELLLYGRSTPLDRWLSRDQELTPTAKPKRRMTSRFKGAIERAVTLKNRGWMRLALILQDVFDENQRGLEHQLRLAAKSLRRSGRGYYSFNTEQALTEGSLAIAIVAYVLAPRDDAREAVMRRMASLIDSGRYSETLTLGIDLADDSSPYHLAAAGSAPWGPNDSSEIGVVLG